jgi:WhiB family redox-sensing transcriptional regulator
VIALGRDADRAWMVDAACRDVNPEIFFPISSKVDPLALIICSGCPVRRQCGDYANANSEIHGVWGGKPR